MAAVHLTVPGDARAHGIELGQTLTFPTGVQEVERLGSESGLQAPQPTPKILVATNPDERAALIEARQQMSVVEPEGGLGVEAARDQAVSCRRVRRCRG